MSLEWLITRHNIRHQIRFVLAIQRFKTYQKLINGECRKSDEE